VENKRMHWFLNKIIANKRRDLATEFEIEHSHFCPYENIQNGSD
jgi:hypothetical protein